MSTYGNKIEKIDVQFKDISYYCKPHIFSRRKIQILKSVYGEFKSGELSAIIGPSGCGKTTLLNILSGYVTLNVKGTLLENGFERNENFNTKICYIMQDEKLQPLLTIKETLMYAAELKLSSKIPIKEKERRVDEILKNLGIYDCRNTRTDNASGGQRKRLSIAVELLHNPPVMFFDEPTSGLDTFASKQLVSLLQNLTQEGRTVICTIHQPSATLLQMFDYLYSIVDGRCMYQGTVENLLPYLESFEPPLKCPKFHNPADYLLEVCRGEYGNYMDDLVEKCGNGKVFIWRKLSDEIKKKMLAKEEEFDLDQEDDKKLEFQFYNNLSDDKKMHLLEVSNESKLVNNSNDDIIANHYQNESTNKQQKEDTLSFNTNSNNPKEIILEKDKIFATSFYNQVCVLIRRGFLILSRDKQLTYTRLVLHVITSLFTGILFFGIGNDARFTLNNFSYIFFTTMFIMYASFTSMLLNFSNDLPSVTKEYFNRWYSVISYYTAITIVDLPIQLSATILYIVTSYFMTDQPREAFRFWLLVSMSYLVALVAQSCGMFISACSKIRYAIMCGQISIMPFLIFCGFFIHMKDAPWFLHWLFHASYLRYGLEGAVQAILGYNREKLACYQDYCHYVFPERFMKEIGMGEPRIFVDFCVLIGYYIVLKIATYLALTVKIGGKR